MIEPISEYLHYTIAKRLKELNIRIVLDMGGTSKMKNRGFSLKNANIKYGIDGRNLPYADNSFDATISIATLEHTGNYSDQVQFLNEAIRVSKKISIHWFPYDEEGKQIEAFKTKIGHKHPCIVPDRKILQYLNSLTLNYYKISPFIRADEHLLMLATMYPKLNKPELYEFVLEHRDMYLGIILEVKK